MSTEKKDINEIINLLRDSNKQFESTIFIPSLNKEIHTKPMSASHLKKVIQISMTGLFVDNAFNIGLYSIFRDVLDVSIPLSKMNILDKIAIILQLRQLNVSDNIEVVLSPSEQTSKLSIKNLINEIKHKKFNFENHIVNVGDYEVTLNFPSIEDEYVTENFFEKTVLSKIDEKNKQSITDVPGLMLLSNILQYIKSIKINENEIPFKLLSPQEKWTIVNSSLVPSKVIKEIIVAIDDVFGIQLNDILKVKSYIDEVEQSGEILIDPGIFT